MAMAPNPAGPPTAHQEGHPAAKEDPKAPYDVVAKAQAAIDVVTGVRNRLRRFLGTEGKSLNADTLEALTASADELDSVLPDDPHVGPKVGKGEGRAEH